jgi:tetratricopeptide (TPR) repeat protein
MIRNARFWIMMTVFQVVFGLVIFTITRQYYIHNSDSVSAESTMKGEPSIASPDRITETNPAQFGLPRSSQPTIEDAALISRQAEEAFANEQYNRAAELYEQLLALNLNNVTAYNNLGITLYYLGRSAEALRKLNEGVAVDPTYQRIWLTLGFVNSQLGDTEQARTALTSAAQMGADNEVGQSALKMLENLPVDTLPLVDSH